MNADTFLLYFYLFVIIVLLWMQFRHMIKKRLYGSRYQYCHILDTGYSGYCHFGDDNKGKFAGHNRTYVRAKIKAGVMYYVGGEPEPQEVEWDKSKTTYYCNSHEFDTVVDNKTLEKMFYIKEADFLKYTFYLSALVAVAVIYLAWNLNGLSGDITYALDVARATAEQSGVAVVEVGG